MIARPSAALAAYGLDFAKVLKLREEAADPMNRVLEEPVQAKQENVVGAERLAVLDPEVSPQGAENVDVAGTQNEVGKSTHAFFPLTGINLCLPLGMWFTVKRLLHSAHSNSPI